MDSNNPFVTVTSQVVTHPDPDMGVTGSQVSFTDFPGTHVTHDQNFILHVDPGFENLVSQFNEGPSDRNGSQTDMEIEWETGTGPHKETHGDGTQGNNGGPIFPKWVWPSVGDRVWLNGAWIYDLGPPIPVPGLGKYGYRSEIHPPRAIAVMGNDVMPLPDTNGVPINVVATNLYIHGDGGLATTVEQEGTIPTILNPLSYMTAGNGLPAYRSHSLPGLRPHPRKHRPFATRAGLIRHPTRLAGRFKPASESVAILGSVTGMVPERHIPNSEAKE